MGKNRVSLLACDAWSLVWKRSPTLLCLFGLLAQKGCGEGEAMAAVTELTGTCFSSPQRRSTTDVTLSAAALGGAAASRPGQRRTLLSLDSTSDVSQ